MARVKTNTEALVHINGWQRADEILREIGELQLKIDAARMRANEQINQAKEELAETIKPIKARIDRYCRSLEVFAVANRGDFRGQKSRTLNFGTIGWRKSTSIRIKKTTLELIKKLLPKKAPQLVIVKESVDKTALRNLTEEELGMIGAKRESKEIFFAEPRLPEVVGYE